MAWTRQGALLMLAAILGWAATPAYLCALSVRSAMQPNCCCGMMSNCSNPGKSMGRQCCQAHPTIPAMAGESSFAVNHPLHAAVIPHRICLLTPSNQRAAAGNTSEASPPHSPPGAVSILRI